MQSFSILEPLEAPPAAEIGKSFCQLKLLPHSDLTVYGRNTHDLLKLDKDAGTVPLKKFHIEILFPTFIKFFSINSL
jgi:hypothetical protein